VAPEDVEEEEAASTLLATRTGAPVAVKAGAALGVAAFTVDTDGTLDLDGFS
jgi:hypothetical protein